MSDLTYAIITPVRSDAANLVRLARCLDAQTTRPKRWLIVDNGSEDETLEVAERLTNEQRWIETIRIPARADLARGAPIVRAFHVGVARLREPADVVVKLDADTSMGIEYFERLVAAFATDPSLGIASGACYEEERGEWLQRHMTGDHVWGASRAYRWDCLQAILPLEERMGWDGIDTLKAQLCGWNTKTILDLPFRHHRAEGARDGSRRRAYEAQGRAAYFMGYRPSYLLLRSLLAATRERPAVAMAWGFAAAALAREPRCTDAAVRAQLRQEQRVRTLPLRAREALGRRP